MQSFPFLRVSTQNFLRPYDRGMYALQKRHLNGGFSQRNKLIVAEMPGTRRG